jgi:hypothetical protein
MEVLDAIQRYRALDCRMVQGMFFPTEPQARRRLNLLYQHGFVERVYRPSYLLTERRGPVYRLARRGAKLLADAKGESLSEFFYWGKGDDRDNHQTQVSHMFLDHLVELAQIRLAFEKSIQPNLGHILEWQDDMDRRRRQRPASVWVTLSAGTRVQVPINPDAYALLTTPQSRGHFFVEHDRGTESVRKIWQRRILAYKEYLRSGLFHSQFGVNPPTGFRVLVVVRSRWRAQNILVAAQKYGPAELSQIFLFAPFADVMGKDALTAPIWLRGGITAPQALL